MVKITFDINDAAPTAATTSTEPVRLSDAAAARIETILANKEENTHLRIAVKGGGCNGFSYDFSLVTDKKDDDIDIINPNYPTLTVWVPEASLIMMQGSTIDFEETLAASQFVVKNPNATSQCGCGSSFGV